MKKRRWAALAALASQLVLGQASAAQSSPGHIVSGPGGTLYLVTDAGRYTLIPTEISDDDLDALPDLGTLGDLPTPEVAAEPPAVPAPPPAPAPEPPAPAPAPASAPPTGSEVPVTVTGQGSLNSRPFGLHGGEYAVTWTAQTSAPECTHGATLHSVDENGHFIQTLGGSQVFGGRGSGQAALHDVPGGSYFVDAISTCRWSITITPQP